MNNIDKIIGRIDEDARLQIERLRADGEEARKKLKEEYAQKTESDVNEIIEAAKAEALRIAERRESSVRLEGRNMTLAMKQSVIAELFNRATEELCKLPEESYITLLAVFAAKASSGGNESIILNEKDREAFGVAVTEKANEMLLKYGKKGTLTLSDETRNIVGGLILSDGRIEYNCAMDAVVGSYKSELEAQAAKILFD